MSRGALYVSQSPRRKIVFHKWPRGCTAKPSRNKCFELGEFRFLAAVADCVIYGPVRNEKFARISVVQVCTHSLFGSWSSLQLLIIAKRSLISPPTLRSEIPLNRSTSSRTITRMIYGVCCRSDEMFFTRKENGTQPMMIPQLSLRRSIDSHHISII